MKKSGRFSAALALFMLFLPANPAVLWSHDQPEAGFCRLEPVTTYFHNNSYFNRIALRTSEAQIWRIYQPAEKTPASKPLFVFFNGGTGGATTAGLFTCNTSHYSIDVDQSAGTAEVIDNPTSWTRIGNLLYIDSRTAGFSYSLMDNPQNDALRQAEFEAQNYNAFIDAADFIRVMLRFLAAHPEIRRNRVIIVPESYGGIRTIVMLHLLLYYRDYANGQSIYQDPTLVQEIQEHYNTVFPEYRGQTVPPDVIARQFGHQIMIQVVISHPYQRQISTRMLEAPGSLLDQLAAETGIPYIRWRDQPGSTGTPTPDQIMNNIYNYLDLIDRDYYLVLRPGGYLLGYFATVMQVLTQYSSLCQMTGVDVAAVPELYASARARAYKTWLRNGNNSTAGPHPLLLPLERREAGSISLPANEGNLPAIFGSLQPWDRYFIELNYDVYYAFWLNRLLFVEYNIYWQNALLFGRMFLETVPWVDTFITNAAYDIIVYSPAIPETLGRYTDILNSSEFDAVGPPGAARPGQILLNYRPASVPGSQVVTRTIRFPFYSNSGHAVTLNEPEAILQDVISWLRSTGMAVVDR